MTQPSLDGQGVYIPMPIDREKLGEKKVEKIHRQIETLEKDMKERQALIDKLTKMHSAENKERERQDKFLEKYNKKNTLKNEMERLYGRDTTVMSLGGEHAGKSNMIDNMIKTRTREHSLKQKEVSIETEFLVKERERLQAARDRVREQRRTLLNAASPAGKKKAPWEFDTIGFLKELGLYHPVKSRTPTPTKLLKSRKRKRKFRYVAVPFYSYSRF